MKKLIAVLMSAIMLVSVIAVSASAAGEILFTDDFSDKFTNTNNWILDGNLFFADDSSKNVCLAAYRDGVISQMEYRYDRTPNARVFAAHTASIKVQIRDFDADGVHRAGLWWRNNFVYISEEDGGVPEDHPYGYVYNIFVNGDDQTVEIYSSENDAEPVAKSDPISDIEVGGDWVVLGWRVAPGKITGYLNNKQVVEYSDPALATIEGASPILLQNNNCYVAFDDIVVATVDYDMFGDLAASGGNENPGTEAGGNAGENAGGNNQSADTNKPAATSVKEVVVTDDKGETKVVTEVVVVPAETNKGGSTVNSSTTTGDAALVVAAVMVIALGTALVVKKVNVK